MALRICLRIRSRNPDHFLQCIRPCEGYNGSGMREPSRGSPTLKRSRSLSCLLSLTLGAGTLANAATVSAVKAPAPAAWSLPFSPAPAALASDLRDFLAGQGSAALSPSLPMPTIGAVTRGIPSDQYRTALGALTARLPGDFAPRLAAALRTKDAAMTARIAREIGEAREAASREALPVVLERARELALAFQEGGESPGWKASIRQLEPFASLFGGDTEAAIEGLRSLPQRARRERSLDSARLLARTLDGPDGERPIPARDKDVPAFAQDPSREVRARAARLKPYDPDDAGRSMAPALEPAPQARVDIPGGMAPVEVVERAFRSVVRIGDSSPRGTGVLISADQPLILTAAHVFGMMIRSLGLVFPALNAAIQHPPLFVRGQPPLGARMHIHDGDLTEEARVRDMQFLTTDPVPEDAIAAPLRDTRAEPLRPGEEVFRIGYSALRSYRDQREGYDRGRILPSQTTWDVFAHLIRYGDGRPAIASSIRSTLHGDSGSPIFDSQGRVAGIIVGVTADGDSVIMPAHEGLGLLREYGITAKTTWDAPPAAPKTTPRAAVAQGRDILGRARLKPYPGAETRRGPLDSGPDPALPAWHAPEPGEAVLDSLFSTLRGNGGIDGRFYASEKGGRIRLRLPLLFAGINKFTPEYYDRVIAPVIAHIRAQGSPDLRAALRGIERHGRPPAREDFTRAAALERIAAWTGEIRRLLRGIGVDAEIDVRLKDIRLAGFETELLSGGTMLRGDELWKALQAFCTYSDAAGYRSKETMTLALRTFPSLAAAMREAPNYNVDFNELPSDFAHEVFHLLFMGKYEGYDDPLNPVAGVMNDMSIHKELAREGVPVSLSPQERLRIFRRIQDAFRKAGISSDAAERAVEASRADLARARERFFVASLSQRRAELSLRDALGRPFKTVSLDPAAWERFLAEADPASSILVEVGASGEILTLQAALTGEARRRLGTGSVRYRGEFRFSGAWYGGDKLPPVQR